MTTLIPEYVALIRKYFPPEAWEKAINVALGESGGNPRAIGDNYPIRGQTIPSYGLFQIRALPGRPEPRVLLDPEENVRFAAQLYKQQGFGPWSIAKKLGYTGGQQTQQSAQQQQPVQSALDKIIQFLPRPTQPNIPNVQPLPQLQSSAIWPVIQSQRRVSSPLASTNPILPTQRRGQSIPEAFYGTKV